MGAPAENRSAAWLCNIAKPAGRFPKRDNWDGHYPPGDGSYEWDGYFDMDVLPEEYNPKRGFSGTANAMSLPEDFIDKFRVGFEWSAPWRYATVGSLRAPRSTQPARLHRFATRLSLDFCQEMLGLPELGSEVPQGGPCSQDGTLF